jgi:hypothetical protein
MDKLKQLTLAFTLMSLQAITAFGGETLTPPCAPGQTETPPCSQMTDGSTDPGETNGPPSKAVDVTTIVEAVDLVLSLF